VFDEDTKKILNKILNLTTEKGIINTAYMKMSPDFFIDSFMAHKNFLNVRNEAGGKMKTRTGWTPPNTDGTNISGFSGLPGGSRNKNGNYEPGNVRWATIQEQNQNQSKETQDTHARSSKPGRGRRDGITA
jgi:hypothetical protein